MRRHCFLILGIVAITLTVFISSKLSGQVIIKEKVVIAPKGKMATDFGDGGIVLRYGGTVWVMAVEPLQADSGWILEPNVFVGPGQGDTATVGPFDQWSEVYFTLQTPFDSTWNGQVFQPDPTATAGILGYYSGFLGFNPCAPPLVPCDTVNDSFSYLLSVQQDSSLACIPPQWVLDDSIFSGGNPYVSNPAAIITLPFGGTYRLTINSGAANGADDLKLILPNDTTILAAAQSYIGDTIVLGPYDAGTRIQLAIISHAAPIVEGMQLYPQMTQSGIAKWDFSFEDWTDLTWDDLSVRLEYNSGIADHLELVTTPDEVDYGDTVSLIVRAVDVNGAFVPLDTNYQFTITMRDTVGYGFLMHQGIVDTTFAVGADSGVGKWFQYAATGVMPSDTVVEIPFHLKAVNQIVFPGSASRPSLHAEQVANASIKNKVSGKNRTVARMSRANPKTITWIIPGTQPDVIENDYQNPEKHREILLGETQYLYVEADNKGKYELASSATPITGQLPTANFDSIKAYIKDGTCSRRLCIYYEYKDSTRKALTNQIRIIGRYWCPESTYLAKILVRDGNKSDRWIIEVKKPSALLTMGQHPTYRLSKDISNDTLNIDSLCIFYGGEYGIPPQFIKGEMLQESQKHAFPGFSGFAPSYRYEPYTTQKEVTGRRWGESAYYVTDDGNMGSPCVPSSTCPPEHLNVYPMPYPTTAQSVWDFVSAHSQLGDPNNGDGTYGVIAPDGTIDLGSTYTTLETEYVLEYLVPALDGAVITTISDSIQTANRNFVNYLRTSWEEIGMDGMRAQTRIASSYGLLQLTYGRAIDIGYPDDIRGANGNESYRPEGLNATDVSLKLAMVDQAGLLYKAVGPFFDWNEGFEKVFKKYVYAKWNKGQSYPQDVLDNSQLFKPTR